MRFAFVREEGLRDASLTQTVQVGLSNKQPCIILEINIKSIVDGYSYTGFVILQCTVAGHHGLSGESVWGPAVFRASSGRSAAQTIQPSMETGERVEEFIGKPAGM